MGIGDSEIAAPWEWDPRSPTDNRAVSALFRVFGGAEPPVVAEAHDFTTRRGMHRHEFRVFAILVPLTVLVALGERLVHSLGPVAGVLLSVPLAFPALNLLPFILGARSQSMQWRLWFACCVGWAVYRREAGGIGGGIGLCVAGRGRHESGCRIGVRLERFHALARQTGCRMADVPAGSRPSRCGRSRDQIRLAVGGPVRCGYRRAFLLDGPESLQPDPWSRALRDWG